VDVPLGGHLVTRETREGSFLCTLGGVCPSYIRLLCPASVYLWALGGGRVPVSASWLAAPSF
jgi:hypothetical protein